MIPLTDEETEFYENQKGCYKILHLNYTIKSEIIVITRKILEELLIVFAI